ncbi:NifB/NifX family molybdenum-iron cluster-binding protein [Desulfurobacterium sp.]
MFYKNFFKKDSCNTCRHNWRKVSLSFRNISSILKVDTETGEIEAIKNIFACGGCSIGCTEEKNAADLLCENGIEGLLTKEIAETPFLKLLTKKIAVYRIPPEVNIIDEAVELSIKGKIKISYFHF